MKPRSNPKTANAHEIAIFKALWLKRVAACRDCCAFIQANFDVIKNLGKVAARDQRAHLDIACHWIANPHGLGAGGHGGDEIIGDAALDKHPRGVRANLATRVEIRIKRGLNGKVKIAIFKHQQRRFSAKL